MRVSKYLTKSLFRFQLDALKATQLAEKYGLLRDGVRQRLEEMLINGVRRHQEKWGEEGFVVSDESDRPKALPLVGEDGCTITVCEL